VKDSDWGDMPPEFKDNCSSPSRAVVLNKSAQHFKSDYLKKEKKTTKAMEEGTICHKYFLEPEEFKKTYCEGPKRSDYPNALVTGKEMSARCKELGIKSTGLISELTERLIQRAPDTQIWTNIVDKVAKGRTVISEDLWYRLERMEEEIKGHFVSKIIYSENCRTELPGYFRHPTTGVYIRFRLDSLMQTKSGVTFITDLKFTSFASEYKFKTNVVDTGALIPAALYVDAVKAIMNVDANFCWIAIQPKPPFIIMGMQADEGELEKGRSMAHTAIRRWQECKKSNKWPGPYPDMIVGATPEWHDGRIQPLEEILENERRQKGDSEVHGQVESTGT